MMGDSACPACGRPTARWKRVASYRFRESGLENVWLRGGVSASTCTACRSKSIRIDKEAQLLQVLALTLLMSPRAMTGPEMRFVRRACELSQAALAATLQLRRETMAEREARDAPNISLADEVLLRLVLLRTFRERLLKPGRNQLTREHIMRLNQFASSLVDSLIGFTQRMRERITAEMDTRHERWSVGKAA